MIYINNEVKFSEYPNGFVYLAIVNTHSYKPFIENSKYDFEQHIINEMKDFNILLWQSEYKNKLIVEINEENNLKIIENGNYVFGSIKVTNGELFLAFYESIGMAAFYKDYPFPDKHMTKYKIELSNGNYIFGIKYVEGKFVILYDKTNELINGWTKIIKI